MTMTWREISARPSFAASSYDSGRTWSAPAPLNVPNPNTRFDAIALRPFKDHILMALNNHRRGPFCEAGPRHVILSVVNP